MPRFLGIVFLLLLAGACNRAGDNPVTVHLELTTQGGPIFFDLQLQKNKVGAPALLFNGPDTLVFNRFEQHDDSLKLFFDALDSYLVYHTKTEQGYWTKRASNGGRKKLPLSVKSSAPIPQASIDTRFDGEWQAEFAESDGSWSQATGIFGFDRGFLQGTFLTETGDFRFLTGNTTTTGFHLWTFDIAHAYAFTATLNPEGTLSGLFYPYNDPPVVWRAKRGASTLRDPMLVTTLKPNARISFSFPDEHGKTVSHTDARFKNKPMLVYIFGSWCPNCADEAKLLREIRTTYPESQLEMVGLAFEYSGNPLEDIEMVKRYRKRFNVSWPTLLAGTSDKADATSKLPFVEKVVSFPTTFFVRRDGSIAAVHTGFYGPSTGAAHSLERQRFRTHLEEILRP